MTRKNKHMTLSDRIEIEKGIDEGHSKTSIASKIGKQPSTVGKEIKRNLRITHRFSLPMECSAYQHCRRGRNCEEGCPDFVPFVCQRRDRSPGACNGCSSYSHCRFTKYRYIARDAQSRYLETLRDSREGVDLTSTEAIEMADIVAPLLRKGQSPYVIVTNNPDLGISEKTLYNYIEQGVFEFAGIDCTSLRRQAGRKMPKKRRQAYKKRHDRTYLNGRTYDSYRKYMDDNPDASVLQMDTVYSDETNGPFMQTFKLVDFGLLLEVYHDTKTAKDMADGLNFLEEEILGKEMFGKYVSCILTDRGSEFTDAGHLEHRADGTFRCPVFYCDPMRSNQKGSLENNHHEVRYIFPRAEKDLRRLGLTDQDSLRIAINSINSYVLKNKHGKTPYEVVRFEAPDLYKALGRNGYRQLAKNEINLTRTCILDWKKNHEK